MNEDVAAGISIGVITVILIMSAFLFFFSHQKIKTEECKNVDRIKVCREVIYKDWEVKDDR